MSASSLSLWQLAHGERIDRDLWPDWTPAPAGRRTPIICAGCGQPLTFPEADWSGGEPRCDRCVS